MRKICEWSKCKEIASGQGLIKKDINKQYKWFCGDHLKIHNKTNDNSCDWKRCKQLVPKDNVPSGCQVHNLLRLMTQIRYVTRNDYNNTVQKLHVFKKNMTLMITLR